MFRLTGGKCQPTVPHDKGRHSVPARGREQRIPEDLGVVVGVDIDEPWGDGKAISLDDLPCIAAHLAHCNDAASLNRNIAGIALCTGAVVDSSVFDEQIVAHRVPPSCFGIFAF